jgi:hypothetical protein
MPMRTKRSVLAAVLTAAVSFGVTAPAAVAAPQDKPSHSKVTKTDKAGTKKADADRKHESRKQSKAQRVAKRKQAAFRATLKKARTAGLPQEIQDALKANVATDRSALAEAVTKELRTFSPARYVQAINVLRKAMKLQAEIDANAVALDALAGGNPDTAVPPVDVTGPVAPTDPITAADAEIVIDLATAVAANEEARVVVEAVVQNALAITGTSSKADIKALKEDLEIAEEALEIVDEFFDALEEAEEKEDEEEEEEEDESGDVQPVA